MVAPAIVGYVASSQAGSGARVLTPHGSTLPDDLMIVVFSTNDIDVTQPGGWTAMNTPNVDTGTLRTAAWYKVRIAGETTYSFTVSGSAGSGFAIISVRGLTVANLVIGAGQTRAASGGAFVTTAPSLNVVSDDNLVLCIATERTSSTEAGIGSVNNGFTQLFWKGHDTPISVIETIWVGTKEVDIGAVGATSVTYTNTQALNGFAWQVAIPPGPPFLGAEVGVWDGATEDVGYVSTWDGVDETPATDILALPDGSYTIADMEADFGANMVYWAHRGGSLNFSEMTMRAYTNAVWHGTKALEYSCQLSSDGVFVGMHDDTLNRVTALTGLVNLQTWATLRSTAVDVPVADGGTISRLEDLLDTYGQDFVLIIEDKTYTHMTEMLDIIEARIPDATDRVIIKTVGAGSTTFPIAAHARGFKTWGYFYDGEVTSEMPTKAVNYDYLGLNYDAIVGNWTTALTYSKPVIAHVVPDLADASSAIGKGAVGLQVSGVLAVVPQVNVLP